MNDGPLTPAALNLLADLVNRATQMATYAELAADADPGKAKRAAQEARDNARTALRILLNAGARLTGGPPEPEASASSGASSLGKLAALDTPHARRFLETLEAAAAAGAEWDREHGRIDAEGTPMGWGGHIGDVTETVRLEVYGHPGSRRE